MVLTIVPRPSPNQDARAAAIDMLVLHYTDMRSAEEALDRLTDPAAKVSAHYTIDEDGTVYAHVPESARAWHAGASSWKGAGDLNSRSIGIELVNPGHQWGYRPFPEAQIGALVALAREIVARHGIPRERVLGHSDIAPTRKQDPGELFPWARLAEAGLGLWPDHPAHGRAVASHASQKTVRALQTDLARIGYGLDVTGLYDEQTRLVVTAFQRHFRATSVTGEADAETVGLIAALVEGAI